MDAFTSRPFSGNPAAVCLLTRNDLSSEQKQLIAAEMNLSETAFVRPVEGEPDVFHLQWFTPTCEVPLCGHATLATAAVLFHRSSDASRHLSFRTLSGTLTAEKDGDFINMRFPLADCAREAQWSDVAEVVQLTAGGLPVGHVAYSSSTHKLLIRLTDAVSRSELEGLHPDTVAMQQAHQGRVRGVIVTVRAQTTDYDFFSRYFGPWNGIPEDPVTGSAHTVLARYWGEELGKTEMSAHQCSRRGGDVRMRVVGEDTVILAGQACIVTKGQIFV